MTTASSNPKAEYIPQSNYNIPQQFYEDRNHFSKGYLVEGDCLKVMPEIPDSSIDMILCDLPYGTTQNKWDSVIPLEELWRQYRRIIKPDGAVALTSHGMFTNQLITSNPEWFKYRMIWVKSKATGFLNAKVQPLRKHEDVCLFYGKQPNYTPPMWYSTPYDRGFRKDQHSGSYGNYSPAYIKSEDGARYPTDVFYCRTAETEPLGSLHPTQKPVNLGRYLIRMYSKPGDIILDNACGTGSFLVAAAIENRKFVGIEKNEDVLLFKEAKLDCVSVAMERLNAITHIDSKTSFQEVTIDLTQIMDLDKALEGSIEHPENDGETDSQNMLF